jgi:N-ethylmaleimide reductase
VTVTLFTPVQVGPHALANRVVMAPLTRCRAGAGGVPTVLNAEHYAQRATAGLIVAEATAVSAQAHGFPDAPGIYNQPQLEGWLGVTEAVHRGGGRIFCQLFHAGRMSVPALQPEGAVPVAPSAVAPRGDLWTAAGKVPLGVPRALETDEVEEIVESFRRAAEFARAAGFDGVEIHAANGYLVAQFLEDGSNRRTDEYGGTVENRIRFALEVTRAAVGVFGAARVGVRVSPGSPFNSMHDAKPGTLYPALAAALSPLGLAYLHGVEADLSNPGDFQMGNFGGAPNAITREMRRSFRGPYITAGGYDGPKAAAVLAAGEADLVAFGRGFIANPDLVRRLREGAPLNEVDFSTLYGGGARGYTDYPSL